MEKIDDLNLSGLKIIQNTDWFCFGTDAVLLANFAHVMSGDTVVDLCTGNGIIPILLYGKTKAKEIIGIEIQKECYDLAQRSANLNKTGDRVRFINGDVKKVNEYLPSGFASCVTCNPPYMNGEWGFLSPTDVKAVARHEILINIDDVIRASAYLLKFGGYLNLVHRAERLCDIFTSMRKYKIEPKKIRFVHARLDTAPKLVLIEGILGAKPSMKIMNPLLMYDENGNYTDEIKKMYNQNL